MPKSKRYCDLNILLLRSTKTTPDSPPPKVVSEIIGALSDFGWDGLVFSRVAYGKVSRDHACDFNPVLWQEKFSVAHGRPSPEIFSRLTLCPENEIDLETHDRDVVASFDLVAVVPMSQGTWTFSCEKALVDIISIDCSSPPMFEIDETSVQLALSRGIKFELCYTPSLSGKRAELSSVARQLIGCMADRGAESIVLSSGATSVMGMRGPRDASNLGRAFGRLEESSVTTVPEALVKRARTRRLPIDSAPRKKNARI